MKNTYRSDPFTPDEARGVRSPMRVGLFTKCEKCGALVKSSATGHECAKPVTR